MSAESSPKIVIVDEGARSCAAILEEGLRGGRLYRRGHIWRDAEPAVADLCARPRDHRHRPREPPAATCWNRCSRSAGAVRRPIAMFVDSGAAASIQASAGGGGNSAYIVDTFLEEGADQPIPDLLRVRAPIALPEAAGRWARPAPSDALEERKVIDRAGRHPDEGGQEGKLTAGGGLCADVLDRDAREKKIGEIAQKSILSGVGAA